MNDTTTELSLQLASSQMKIFPKTLLQDSYDNASTLNAEPFSFQAVLRLKQSEQRRIPVTVSVRAPGLPLSVYLVDYHPVLHTADDFAEEGYEHPQGDLYPDLLAPRPADPQILTYGATYFEKDCERTVHLSTQETRSLWITVNEDSAILQAGTYPITVEVRELNRLTLLATKTFTLKIGKTCLQKNDAYYTNWFHCDSLADAHGVEVYSERFFEILLRYLTNAARHGMNTLLIPVFTPPLDTPVGAQRKNVQLLDIYFENGRYRFDFSRVKQFWNLAQACGIRYFEHNHLFTQWGAAHAPNIYVWERGKLIHRFGWDTDAAGDDYLSFLKAYLPAFLDFAKQEGFADRIVFHISDEPTVQWLDSYRAAVEAVRPLLDGYPCADALCEVEFYQQGLVQTPVATIDRAAEFEGVCPDFWLYYTGGTYYHTCTNRLLTNTAPHTRILGLHLYRYGAKGFLHWGYNYYYDRLSHGRFDPKSDPCGYKLLPGASYLVYPDPRGGVFPSIREKLMMEAFCDRMALQALESKIGREATLALCEKHFGRVDCHTIPTAQALLAWREEINDRLEEEA